MILLIKMKQQYEKIIVLLITAIFSLVPFLPKFWGFVPFILLSLLTCWSFQKQEKFIFRFSLFGALTFLLIAPQRLTSQIFFTIALVILWFIERRVPWIPRAFPWLTPGKVTIAVLLFLILFVLLTAAILMTWYLLFHPDVSDILSSFFPRLSLALLIVGGLLFAMFNAAVEEFVYRGFLMHILEETLNSTWLPLLIQALAFGLLHINGFPRGWIGVGLAFIYGIFMGLVRKKSNGMFAPWLAHVLTDLAIVFILIFLSQDR